MAKRIITVLMTLCLVIMAPLSTAFAVSELTVTDPADLLSYVEDINDGTLTGKQTIVLKTNVVLTSTLTFNAGTTVVLDLNGHTISGVSDVANHSLIVNKGILTIKDSSASADALGTGKISYTYTGAADTSFSKGNYTIVNSAGTLTVESGTIENLTDSSLSHMIDAIDNNSTGGETVLTVNGGYIFSNNRYGIRMFANHKTAKNIVVVNGGKVEGNGRGIWIHLPGSNTETVPAAELTITGGEVATRDTDGYNMAVYSYTYGNNFGNTKITVTGGTLTGDIAMTGGSNKTTTETVSVTGGTFTGDYGIYTYGEITEGFIFGGSFAGEIDPEYLADGVNLVQDENGNYVAAVWHEVIYVADGVECHAQ